MLTLQLRQHTKEAAGSKAEMIGRVEHADENKVGVCKVCRMPRG